MSSVCPVESRGCGGSFLYSVLLFLSSFPFLPIVWISIQPDVSMTFSGLLETAPEVLYLDIMYLDIIFYPRVKK